MSETSLDLSTEVSLPPEELAADYNARATVGDRFAEEIHAYRLHSDAARAQWLSRADIVYDAESGGKLDLYGLSPRGNLCPVFLFVHGGYWRALSRFDSAMMAGMLAEQGIATAVIDYRLAPEATLTEIVRQVRAALAFLWRKGAALGIDPGQIHVGGSSAGGHLAATLIANGWHAQFGVPETVVKSALLISGLFELAPIAATFPQDWLCLDREAVAAVSPIRHIPGSGCPIIVAWAENEAGGFKRQSQAFHAAWTKAGLVSSMLEVPGRNHFDVILELGSSDTGLSRSLLSLIRGAA